VFPLTKTTLLRQIELTPTIVLALYIYMELPTITIAVDLPTVTFKMMIRHHERTGQTVDEQIGNALNLAARMNYIDEQAQRWVE
jgi:hypothetical protein